MSELRAILCALLLCSESTTHLFSEKDNLVLIVEVKRFRNNGNLTFTVETKVLRRVKGEFGPNVFRFQLHSPARAGMALGDIIEVKGTIKGDDLYVDPRQFNSRKSRALPTWIVDLWLKTNSIDGIDGTDNNSREGRVRQVYQAYPDLLYCVRNLVVGKETSEADVRRSLERRFANSGLTFGQVSSAAKPRASAKNTRCSYTCPFTGSRLTVVDVELGGMEARALISRLDGLIWLQKVSDGRFAGPFLLQGQEVQRIVLFGVEVVKALKKQDRKRLCGLLGRPSNSVLDRLEKENGKRSVVASILCAVRKMKTQDPGKLTIEIAPGLTLEITLDGKKVYGRLVEK